MNKIERNTFPGGVSVPGDQILKDVASTIIKHFARPEGADSPVIICGTGLHPDEVEAHFLICKLQHKPIHPISFQQCNYKNPKDDAERQAEEEKINRVEERLIAIMRVYAGDAYTREEAKKIEADFHNAMEDQPTKPILVSTP